MQLKADNYFFVMDDYQAIFDFDPIDPGDVNIGLDLAESGDWVTYFLKNNYRSGTDILRFAGSYVHKLSRKLDKVVKPCAPYGGKVELRGKFSFVKLL
jgi:superfamily I DNA/RNA helicase